MGVVRTSCDGAIPAPNGALAICARPIGARTVVVGAVDKSTLGHPNDTHVHLPSPPREQVPPLLVGISFHSPPWPNKR